MKTRHFLKLQGSALALGLCGMALAATAPAQEAPTGAGDGPSFQSLDQNQDGHLVRSEIPASMSLLRSRFPTYDANHDRVLDVREYAAAQAALTGSGNAGGSDSTAPSPRNDSDTSGH